MQFSHTGITITDASLPDNPIIDCNPAFEVITGYSRREVLGKNCRFLQHDDVDQDTLGLIRKAINQQQHITVVIKNYRKDGSMFWNELSISPVYNAKNRLTHFIGIQNNVTVRETAQRELTQQNTELSKMNVELQSKNQQQKDIDDRINELLIQSHSHIRPDPTQPR
ncbi:MAG TPA: PAS domain-containing protein [Candidatus Saccharimonadales bacterium]|nr:PAS domain-containing protein [Candidatus Saccharimonadales bacterium]